MNINEFMNGLGVMSFALPDRASIPLISFHPGVITEHSIEDKEKNPEFMTRMMVNMGIKLKPDDYLRFFNDTLPTAPNNCYGIYGFLVALGTIDGYHYTIRNMGTHPSAYVHVPTYHPIFKMERLEEVIPCHCSISYIAGYPSAPDGYKIIGWNYCHSGDFIYEPHKQGKTVSSGKIWSKEEIIEQHIKPVIQKLTYMQR